jgi:ParB-like chromosome segregation protein Spo0J
VAPLPKNAASPQGVIGVHPLAKEFPLITGAEFDALVADIKTRGLQDEITLFEDLILDGRHRYRACLRAKVEPRFKKFKGDRATAAAFVISRNIHRRHLKSKEKRDLLVKLVAAQPKKSDREHAREAGVHHSAISRARRVGESTGAIAPVERRTGKDGKKRKQPAKKPPKPQPQPSQPQPPQQPPQQPPPQQQPSQPQPSQPQPQPRGTAVEAGGQPAAPPKPGTPEERNADAKWALEMATSNRDAAVRLLDLLRDKERRVAFVKALAAAITIRPAENAVTAVAPANADK